jgi:hypothetical protein
MFNTVTIRFNTCASPYLVKRHGVLALDATGVLPREAVEVFHVIGALAY